MLILSIVSLLVGFFLGHISFPSIKNYVLNRRLKKDWNNKLRSEKEMADFIQKMGGEQFIKICEKEAVVDMVPLCGGYYGISRPTPLISLINKKQ